MSRKYKKIKIHNLYGLDYKDLYHYNREISNKVIFFVSFHLLKILILWGKEMLFIIIILIIKKPINYINNKLNKFLSVRRQHYGSHFMNNL